MSFIRDLAKVGSVGFVEMAVEHVAKKAGARRFIIYERTSNRHFLNPLSEPLVTGEGLCHVEFLGAPDDARNWFVGSADIKNAVHQKRIPGWLPASFTLPAVLASEVGFTGKVIDKKRPVTDSLICPAPATLPTVFSLAMFFCQDVTNHFTRAGGSDSLLFPGPLRTPRCLVVGSVGFRWSYWLEAPTAPMFISHVS